MSLLGALGTQGMCELAGLGRVYPDLVERLSGFEAGVFKALAIALTTHEQTELTPEESALATSAQREIEIRQIELTALQDNEQFSLLLQAAIVSDPTSIAGLLEMRDTKREELPVEIASFREKITGLSEKKSAAGVAAWGQSIGTPGRVVAGTRVTHTRLPVVGHTIKVKLVGGDLAFIPVYAENNWCVWEKDTESDKFVRSDINSTTAPVQIGSGSFGKKVARLGLKGLTGKMKNGDEYTLEPGADSVTTALTKGSGYLVNIGGMGNVDILDQEPSAWESAQEMDSVAESAIPEPPPVVQAMLDAAELAEKAGTGTIGATRRQQNQK